MYTCSYFIEIISQFGANWGTRCFYRNLKIKGALNRVSEITISIAKSQLNNNDVWNDGDNKFSPIEPVVNDIVRIFAGNSKEFKLIFVGSIQKAMRDFSTETYNFQIKDIQNIGLNKTAKFYSKSNIQTDINDFDLIRAIYEDQYSNTSPNLSIKPTFYNLNDLKKTKYGLELRGSDTFQALISNLLNKHNAHQFIDFKKNGLKTDVNIILNRTPNKLLTDNLLYEINVDKATKFIKGLTVGNSPEASPKPQVIQKYDTITYKTEDEESDDGARYYIFSDMFFNLSGAEGYYAIDSHSVAGYYENEEWKTLKDAIKNHDDPTTFKAEFRSQFIKAKNYLNQVAFRQLLSDLTDNFKVNITLSCGHLVPSDFLNALGKNQKEISKIWEIGLAVSFTCSRLGYINKKMIITGIELESNGDNNSGKQFIILTLVEEEFLLKSIKTDNYTFNDIIKVDVAPILENINTNEKIKIYREKVNKATKDVIAFLRYTFNKDSRAIAQRRLLSPALIN